MAIQAQFLMERQGKTFALYAGLLDAAHGEGLKGIRTTLLQVPSDDNGHVAIVHAVVVTEKGEFAGLGDASPLNVARPMVTCLIRMAETRAKARALRDAVNVGVAAVEELGGDDADDDHKSRRAPRREDVDFVQTRQPRQSPGRAQAAVAQMADADAPSTPAQHRAIAQIGGSVHGWDNAAIEQYATERFGRRLVELTKGQASQIIQTLQQQGATRAG